MDEIPVGDEQARIEALVAVVHPDAVMTSYADGAATFTCQSLGFGARVVVPSPSGRVGEPRRQEEALFAA